MNELANQITQSIKAIAPLHKAKIFHGLPTKCRKLAAGVEFLEGGLYAFISDSTVLYFGECKSFYDRLTPKHHKIKSVAPANDLKGLLFTLNPNDQDVRKAAEAELIREFNPVFNASSDVFYKEFYQDGVALDWAIAVLASCTNSGYKSYRNHAGEFISTESYTDGFNLYREDGDLGLSGIDARHLNVDHDEIKIAIAIAEDFLPIKVWRIDDTKIALADKDFRGLFPNITIANARTVTPRQSEAIAR
jgi:hypothetical protein